jgi:hypothetical protein
MTETKRPAVTIKNKDSIFTANAKIENYLPEGVTLETVQHVDAARDALTVDVLTAAHNFSDKHNVSDYTVKPVTLGGNATLKVAAVDYKLTTSTVFANSDSLVAILVKSNEYAAGRLAQAAADGVASTEDAA